MPALTEEQKRCWLLPYREILRRVQGVAGAVEMEAVFAPRPDYGQVIPHLELRGPHDACSTVGHQLFHLRSDLPFSRADARARSRFVVRSGERHYFALAYSESVPSVYPNLGEAAEREIAMSLDFWRRWSAQCRYDGPFAAAVLRSALTLKPLAYAPSRAVIAAPTTSLPEAIGGVRNWDYRYCWLRDASFTVAALYDLGFSAEGDAFVQWLLQATALTHPALQVLYTSYGNAHIPERTLTDLTGYRNSRPVRVGNAAAAQFQLDVYGEVLGALKRYYHQGATLDADTRGLLVGAADLVARRWNEPDHGIWELRAGRVQNVHGKAMAWFALDCAEQLARAAGIRADVDNWARTKEAIRSVVFRDGFNGQLNSFVSTLRGQHLDASLLRLPLIGFIKGDDPHILSTITAVREHLGVGDLIYRYRGVDDGLPGQEGAFLPCSFWLVSSLALAGRVDEARAMFARLLSRANDLGLFSEEIDPANGEFLGNFPQGVTHVALINAAWHLNRAVKG